MEGVKRPAESHALMEMGPPKVPRTETQLVGLDPETKKQLLSAVRLNINKIFVVFVFELQ